MDQQPVASAASDPGREPRDPTPTPAIPPEILEKVIVGGDLAELTAPQRAEYYEAV